MLHRADFNFIIEAETWRNIAECSRIYFSSASEPELVASDSREQLTPKCLIVVYEHWKYWQRLGRFGVFAQPALM
jgi:hypothetical protein